MTSNHGGICLKNEVVGGDYESSLDLQYRAE